MTRSEAPSIDTLKKSGDVDGLIAALAATDPDHPRRAFAIHGDAAAALGDLGDDRAREPILSARREIVELLAMFDAGGALQGIGIPSEERQVFTRALDDMDAALRKIRDRGNAPQRPLTGAQVNPTPQTPAPPTASSTTATADPLVPRAAPASQAYLILLWDSAPFSDLETREIVEGKRAELGCSTRLLKSVRVDGQMPEEPNDYVVSTALLACQEAGVAFDATRDDISYRGGKHPTGQGLGLITVTVHAAAPPPAWYADPRRGHELRYWDGAQWTDWASDRGQTSADPMGGPATDPATTPLANPVPAATPPSPEIADGQQQRQGQQTPGMPARKSPAWHAAASCFLPGLGTILCGRTKKGLLILGLSAFLLIGVNLLANALIGGEPKGIGTFLAIPVWVWGMVDGHRSAQQWNLDHGIKSAAGGRAGNGAPSQPTMSPALDPGARIIPQADPHAQTHRAPNGPSIVLTAASEQMVTQLTSDRFFLMGVLMGDPSSEARTFMAALNEGRVTHEVSRDPAGPGFIVRLTITKNPP